MANEIILNKEAFEQMGARFENVFTESLSGAELAGKVMSMDQNAVGGIGSAVLVGAYSIRTEVIRTIVRMVIESITTADDNIRQEAEKIVGPEIHHAVSTGGYVEYDKNGNYIVHQSALEEYQGLRQHLSDNCTNTCLAMIIQRYYLLHYGSCDLVYDDINFNDFYWSVENYAREKCSQLPDGHTYYADGNTPQNMSESGGGSLQAGLATQLNIHPEGITLYGNYANGGSHAIVVTGYTMNSDGSYNFTAIDPATGATTSLTETTLFLGRSYDCAYSSVDEMLGNLHFFQYISTVW